jgi:DNA-binding phage protein
MKKTISYEDLRTEVLSDFETASHYLQHALKGNDLGHFMEAFARVVEAQGGVGKFAEKTRLSRQSIYNAINNKSLRADSFFEIVRGLGLRVDLVPKEPAPHPHRAGSAHIHRRQHSLAAA